MTYQKTRKSTALISVALAVIIIMAGCSGSGSEGNGSSEDPRDVDFDAVYNTINTASSNIDNLSASVYASYGSYFFTIFAAYVEEWDGASSYTYGSVTVEVTKYDGMWIWTYTDSSTGDTVEYRVESTSSGWSFTWTINGEEYVSGTISTNGLTGSVDYFDTYSDEKVFSYSFEPYSGDYDLEIKATSFSSGSVDAEVLIRTSSDGNTGTWEYNDYNASSNSDSGAW